VHTQLTVSALSGSARLIQLAGLFMILPILLWLTDIQQDEAWQKSFVYGAFGVVGGLTVINVVLVKNYIFPKRRSPPQSWCCQGRLVHVDELRGRVLRQINWGAKLQKKNVKLKEN
jgi:hypothetical protein